MLCLADRLLAAEAVVERAERLVMDGREVLGLDPGDPGAAQRAGIQARIDAPQLQRQDEAFGYGRAATDLDLIRRESQGDEFVNQLRLRAIRRRPGMDLLAGGLQGAGNSMAGGYDGSGIGPVVKQPITY